MEKLVVLLTMTNSPLRMELHAYKSVKSIVGLFQQDYNTILSAF